MLKPLEIKVTESVQELRNLQKKYPSRIKPLQMLILLKQQGPLGKKALVSLLGAGDRSITKWRCQYADNGVYALLEEHRGGYKKSKITQAVKVKLEARLRDPKNGFRSFIEIKQWLSDEFDVVMEYQAVHKYVTRNFGAKLKVSRKSHVLKSPADEVVFKKSSRKA